MGMPLILFGAGASYGSDTEGTPPLGGALLDALQAFDPETWGRIPPADANGFRADFEQGMKAYTEAHPSDGTVDRLQRAMAAYFFQFRPEGSNLYRKLAERIHRRSWRGTLASLNYERLLELSLRTVGLNVGIGNCPGDYVLCLPHGYCCIFVNMRLEGPIVLGSMNLRMDSRDGICVVDCPNEFESRIQQDRLPPVMSYFEPTKAVRCGASFIKSQRDRFASLVESASAIAVVGVRVRRHDQHLWKPLAQTNARLVYCAGESAVPEFESWAKGCGRSGDLVLAKLSSDSFDEVCEAISL